MDNSGPNNFGIVERVGLISGAALFTGDKCFHILLLL